MSTRIPFLRRSRGSLSILLYVICLLGTALAQHGVGGGHFGGGHFGGGHSSGHDSGKGSGGEHASGHFGWLHGFGRHSARHVRSASSTSDASARGPSSLWSVPTTARGSSISRIPSTLLWSPPVVPRRADSQGFFISSAMRLRRGVFDNRFRRFSSSQCFFNGVSQVCFFEPFLPLLCLSGGFYFPGFGFGDDSFDLGENLNSQELMQAEMSVVPPANSLDDDTAAGNLPARPGVMLGAAGEQQALGKGVFLLVLNNGNSLAVTDYWVAEGYLEYISTDGARSHVPLEALDLQETVSQNAPRGVPFVLRSGPAGNR